MRPDQDSVERIRRHEVSRALKKTNLSPEDQEVLDLFSRALIGRLLHGPISEVLARAELPFGDRPGREAPHGLERRGWEDKVSGTKRDYQISENGEPYVEYKLENERVSGKPA
jgi:hypothetical protein